MPYINVPVSDVEIAKELAKTIHFGQKYGHTDHDYFEYHICGVVAVIERAIILDSIDSITANQLIICGYLHDVVEDSRGKVTVDDIRVKFGNIIGDAVDGLSKRLGEEPNMYLERCRHNELSRFVKICDGYFNMSNSAAEGNEKRASYYKRNIDFMNRVIDIDAIGARPTKIKKG